MPKGRTGAMFATTYCAAAPVDKHWPGQSAWGRGMSKPDEGFDYHRYRNLLAEAVDERSRLAFIDLLIEERARERLRAHSTSERLAITAKTVASILGTSRT